MTLLIWILLSWMVDFGNTVVTAFCQRLQLIWATPPKKIHRLFWKWNSFPKAFLRNHLLNLIYEVKTVTVESVTFTCECWNNKIRTSKNKMLICCVKILSYWHLQLKALQSACGFLCVSRFMPPPCSLVGKWSHTWQASSYQRWKHMDRVTLCWHVCPMFYL